MKTTKQKLEAVMSELQELAKKVLILTDSDDHKHVKAIRENYEKEAAERCQELQDQIQLHYVIIERDFIKGLLDGRK